MVYAQPRNFPGEWDAQTPLEFWDTNGSLNISQTTRPCNNRQKKKTCRIVTVAVPVEREKKDKYLDLARELKNFGTWK